MSEEKKVETTTVPTPEVRLEKVLEVMPESDVKFIKDMLAEKDTEIARLTNNINAMVVMISDSWELVQQMNVSIKSIGKTLSPLLQPGNNARRG